MVWSQEAPSYIGNNMEAICVHSKKVKEVTVECGDADVFRAIDDTLALKGFIPRTQQTSPECIRTYSAIDMESHAGISG